MWLNRWGSDGELNLATALSHSSVFCFQIRRRTFRDDLQKPDILSSAWLHKHLAHALTVHYVEYERQHRAAGGGVWDVHGVFPDVEPQRALVQHRLVQGTTINLAEHNKTKTTFYIIVSEEFHFDLRLMS